MVVAVTENEAFESRRTTGQRLTAIRDEALRGEGSVPRMAYLAGALELMRPSKDHERTKSYVGRLVEAYALDRGIDLSPYGA